VLVVGAGALGSPVALYLAGAGVGRLGIADPDTVELSNLHRQLLHFTPDVGIAKAQSAASKLRFLNPEVEVVPYEVRLQADNAEGLLEGHDVVVDCSDSFATRYAVNAACCAAGVPLVEGGVVGWSGLVMSIRPGESACYRCAFPQAPPPGAAPTCAEAGVLGPAAGVVGSLQALEAIKLLTGVAPPIVDAFVQLDLAGASSTRVAVARLPPARTAATGSLVGEMLGLGTVTRVAGELRRDVTAVRDRDPAARTASAPEILATWPGVHALLTHRVAHALDAAGLPVVPRVMAHVARMATGIEIHPSAEVGDGLFVDHGSGVVVGETAQIGDNVTIYQGVTLGGTGFATGKRHPTVQDNVTIGAGAQLLGPITVGHGAKIGANAVVIHDVPPNATVVGNPGHPVRIEGRRPEGPDADWVHLPDPIADALKAMAQRVAELERTVAELRGDEDAAPGADVVPLRPVRGPNPAGG
jgi:serine O-acetyltransferase